MKMMMREIEERRGTGMRKEDVAARSNCRERRDGAIAINDPPAKRERQGR